MTCNVRRRATRDALQYLAHIQSARKAEHKPRKCNLQRLHSVAQHVHEDGGRLRLHQHLKLTADLVCSTRSALQVTRQMSLELALHLNDAAAVAADGMKSAEVTRIHPPEASIPASRRIVTHKPLQRHTSHETYKSSRASNRKHSGVTYKTKPLKGTTPHGGNIPPIFWPNCIENSES